MYSIHLELIKDALPPCTNSGLAHDWSLPRSQDDRIVGKQSHESLEIPVAGVSVKLRELTTNRRVGICGGDDSNRAAEKRGS
jgi:hypothetical protein